MISDHRPSGGAMLARIVMLMLIAMLALPSAALPRSAEPSHSLWGDGDVAANGKKHKRKSKPPRPKAITRTIRQSVTETFANPERINIPVVEILVNDGPADPYPSEIAISGFSNGTITDVNVILEEFTHSGPSDVDVLLSTSGGRQALVLSDVGGAIQATEVEVVLDDEAATPLPNGQLQSGTFRPTNLTANV